MDNLSLMFRVYDVQQLRQPHRHGLRLGLPAEHEGQQTHSSVRELFGASDMAITYGHVDVIVDVVATVDVVAGGLISCTFGPWLL